LPLSSEARADQGCRKRRNQVPDWSEITCRFPPKSPAAFDRNQVPVCSDFCTQSEKHWRRIALQLERQGLPKIDPIMKGRYWPAVEAFFRNRHGLSNMVGSQPDGEEMWDVP
jgi:hypothetical protein